MNEIRVMSFNIMGESFPEDGENIWANRAALNARVILGAGPDLIGLQEVVPENLEFYAQALPAYEALPTATYGGDLYPGTILWNTSTLERIEHGIFWLSQTPDSPSLSWDVPYPMVVSWVKLRRKSDGLTLLHFNTHLEDGPDGERQRVESSKLIAARAIQMQAGQYPLILTGDFNCNPGSDCYHNLVAAGFVDAFLSAGNVDGEISSFHGFEGEAYDTVNYGGPDADPFWRVDWIMLRQGAEPLRVERCAVITDAEPPLYPSDHYPVLALLMPDVAC
jgi:endonuclease/exonuclease/phosphatase family metal-dependent hydrolase